MLRLDAENIELRLQNFTIEIYKVLPLTLINRRNAVGYLVVVGR